MWLVITIDIYFITFVVLITFGVSIYQFAVFYYISCKLLQLVFCNIRVIGLCTDVNIAISWPGMCVERGLFLRRFDNDFLLPFAQVLHFATIFYYLSRRYYISQRFCITLCVGNTFRNVYYIMRFNTRPSNML